MADRVGGWSLEDGLIVAELADDAPSLLGHGDAHVLALVVAAEFQYGAHGQTDPNGPGGPGAEPCRQRTL